MLTSRGSLQVALKAVQAFMIFWGLVQRLSLTGGHMKNIACVAMIVAHRCSVQETGYAF
jgi:hypothetical protein